MFPFARSSVLILALAALFPGGRTAHAQAAPVPYANSNWFLGLGGNTGLEGSDERNGISRTNFPSGWFIGSTRNDFGMSGFNRAAAFGNFGSLSTEGAQFGYALKNTPLSIYAGFDTLKYNVGSPPAATRSRLSTPGLPQCPAPSAPMQASSTGRRESQPLARGRRYAAAVARTRRQRHQFAVAARPVAVGYRRPPAEVRSPLHLAACGERSPRSCEAGEGKSPQNSLIPDCGAALTHPSPAGE